MDTAVVPTHVSVDRVEAVLKSQLSKIVAMLGKERIGGLRKVLNVLCEKLEYDPETRNVEINFAIPNWAISEKPKMLKAVGVVENGSRTEEHDANGKIGLFLAKVELKASVVKGRWAKYHRKTVCKAG